MRILINDNIKLVEDEYSGFNLEFKKFEHLVITNEKLCRKGLEIGYCDYCKRIGIIVETTLSGGRKNVNKCKTCSALEMLHFVLNENGMNEKLWKNKEIKDIIKVEFKRNINTLRKEIIGKELKTDELN